MKIIKFLFLLIPLGIFAQFTPEINVSTDTLNIRIGEQVEYKISVVTEGKVDFPVLENLKNLEVIQELDAQKVKDAMVKKYLITGFDSGSFYIKQQAIYVDNHRYITDSLLVNVASVKVDTLQQPAYGIQPLYKAPVGITEVKYIVKEYGVFIIILVLIPLALLLLSNFLSTKKKVKTKKEIIIPAYDLAQQQFTRLASQQLWQENKVKEYYSELTEIVRAYIGNELQLNTLELTTSELIDLLNSYIKSNDFNLEKDKIENLHKLLKQADFVKFAKQKPIAHEIETDENIAKEIVESIYKLAIEKQQVLDSPSTNSGQADRTPNKNKHND